jgi:hypothetical protein
MVHTRTAVLLSNRTTELSGGEYLRLYSQILPRVEASTNPSPATAEQNAVSGDTMEALEEIQAIIAREDFPVEAQVSE